MTYNQKIKFVKKYINKYVKIKKWVYLHDRFKEHHGIAMSIDTYNRIIYLNKFWLNKTNDTIIIKSVLLHEIGHLKTRNKAQKYWERELYAQLWACKEAYRKKAAIIYRSLVSELLLWGCPKYLKWNSNERKYIMAHKAAVDTQIMKISVDENNGISVFMDYYKVL